MAAGSVVPARARELAARLSVLFERDVELVERLNDAQRRLRDANERLESGLSPDAGAPGGASQIAALGAGGPESQMLAGDRPAWVRPQYLSFSGVLLHGVDDLADGLDRLGPRAPQLRAERS